MPRQDFRLVFIPSTLHFLIIRPVHHVSSSIITLFLFLLYTMIIATVEATTRGSSFFIAYNAVIDYSCGSQFLLGDIWEYLFVTLGLIGSVCLVLISYPFHAISILAFYVYSIRSRLVEDFPNKR
uniref:Uncharacterized protein n=1 Tax=Heterorhabditis bacteriophora TaxID=37862 RepID=A0A1I7XTB3_HETBA